MPATGDVVGLSIMGLLVALFVGLGLTALRRKRGQNLAALEAALEAPSALSEEPEAQEAPRAPAPVVDAEETRAAYRRGLERTRGSMWGGMRKLLGGGRQIDAKVVEELEPLLIGADVGVKTTAALLDAVKARLDRGELGDVEKVRQALKEEMSAMLARVPTQAEAPTNQPHVTMVVGVNGAGKTTTIGKLAHRHRNAGRSVVLGAGDTFRAAAVEQLKVWGDRAGCVTVEGAEGSDSAAVLFEAVKRGNDEGTNLVICDTAGRLHTKVNLMEELKKVQRVLGKALPGAPHDVLLVVDGTTGQNAVVQAEQFHQALGLTGVVLTKLDGTAKGGVVLAIAAQLGIPIRYVGVGEKLEDLREFDGPAFVEGLFADDAS